MKITTQQTKVESQGRTLDAVEYYKNDRYLGIAIIEDGVNSGWIRMRLIDLPRGEEIRIGGTLEDAIDSDFFLNELKKITY